MCNAKAPINVTYCEMPFRPEFALLRFQLYSSPLVKIS